MEIKIDHTIRIDKLIMGKMIKWIREETRTSEEGSIKETISITKTTFKGTTKMIETILKVLMINKIEVSSTTGPQATTGRTTNKIATPGTSVTTITEVIGTTITTGSTTTIIEADSYRPKTCLLLNPSAFNLIQTFKYPIATQFRIKVPLH